MPEKGTDPQSPGLCGGEGRMRLEVAGDTHLLRKRASHLERIADFVLAPFNLVGGLAKNALKLRKEFWLVAVRT